MAWKTVDDFQRDLQMFSDFNEFDDEDFKPTPPKSVAEYKARINFANNRSIYDTEKEDVCYYISGRGKFMKDRAVRPGQIVEPTVQDELMLKKMIRDVTGLGYSNEIIEDNFRASARQNRKQPEIASNLNLVLDDSFSASSSPCRSLRESPLQESYDSSSDSGTPSKSKTQKKGNNEQLLSSYSEEDSEKESHLSKNKSKGPAWDLTSSRKTADFFRNAGSNAQSRTSGGRGREADISTSKDPWWDVPSGFIKSNLNPQAKPFDMTAFPPLGK